MNRNPKQIHIAKNSSILSKIRPLRSLRYASSKMDLENKNNASAQMYSKKFTPDPVYKQEKPTQSDLKRPPCRQSSCNFDLEGKKYQRLAPFVSLSFKSHPREAPKHKFTKIASLACEDNYESSRKFPLIVNRSSVKTRASNAPCLTSNRILSSNGRSRPVSFFTDLEYEFIGLFSN